jgi:hypothetical protein
MEPCFICGSNDVAVFPEGADTRVIDCKRCGLIAVDELFLLTTVRNRLENNPKLRPRLRYWFGRRIDRKHRLDLDPSLFERILSEELPAPREQADNLILWMSGQVREQNPGGAIPFDYGALASIVGAFEGAGVAYIADQLKEAGLIAMAAPTAPNMFRLTFKGWDRFAELSAAQTEIPTAFMAMPFNNPLLDEVFESCFKPATKLAGFELRRNIDNQSAGIIDNQLRVDIRKSRFLISDLTNGNHGAYWEAGFAEGLGKKVIYTCEKSFFTSAKTHFDTNHCTTILWEKENLPLAAKTLTATIRATLPQEARMGD